MIIIIMFLRNSTSGFHFKPGPSLIEASFPFLEVGRVFSAAATEAVPGMGESADAKVVNQETGGMLPSQRTR